ncbi:MAG: hypothetical protein AAF465_06225 [Pseudomonadota bacterium]
MKPYSLFCGLVATGLLAGVMAPPVGAELSSRPESAESAAKDQPIASTYRIEFMGNIQNAALREASGLAVSTRSENVFWSHNDSGYGPSLFAFGEDGEPRGRFLVERAVSKDWEDMASFRWRGESWLLIADVGDNSSRKPFYTLYLAKEPPLPKKRSNRLLPLRNVQMARLTYPTGAADTEAVAVDSRTETVYLVSKRERPARVFSVPLSAFGSEDIVTAQLETELYALPAPTLQDILDHPNLGFWFAQPSAMDIAPDGTFAVIHTYGHSYRFDRAETESWAEALAKAPRQIEVPAMKQSEAVAIGLDSRNLYYTSEGRNPPLYRLVPDGAD